MGFLVLLIVLGLPVAEIWLMIDIGQEIGALPTVALILATAALGMLLFRIQGLATLARVQEQLDRGETPVGEVLSGLGLLFAGLMLLIPGFLTDAVGLILFIPPVRRLLVGAMVAWVVARGSTRIWTLRAASGPGPGARPPSRHGGGPVIDGDFRDVSEPPGGQPPAAQRLKPDPEDPRKE